METIKVTFDDGNTLCTRINGSQDEILRYYIGNYFNLGQYDDPTKDNLRMAVAVQFLKDAPAF